VLLHRNSKQRRYAPASDASLIQIRTISTGFVLDAPARSTLSARVQGSLAANPVGRVMRPRCTGGPMFSLHLPRRLTVISRSFAGIDRGALLVALLAVVSWLVVVAAFVAVA
jgi:hypothetical protein